MRYIGDKIKNPHNKGHFTIVGIPEGRQLQMSIFRLLCEVCQKDEELFGDGVFEFKRQQLDTGVTPCGCYRGYRWTKDQYRVKISRLGVDKNYEFISFEGDREKITNKVKVEIKCLIHNTIHKVTITGLLGGRGCRLCANNVITKSKTKEDKPYLESLIKEGMFPQGTLFTRNIKDKCKRGDLIYWDVYCPICSSDEYVNHKLCTGIFKTTANGIKLGYKNCRCSKTFKWTKGQREYQINKVMEREGCNFIGWDKEFKTANSKFKWVCEQGHTNTTSVTKFFDKGTRCSTCASKTRCIGKPTPSRLNEVDNLYIINFNGDYIKIGRSFNIEKRIKELSLASGIYRDFLEIVGVYSADHFTIYMLEQLLHKCLNSMGYSYVKTPWVKETFLLECLPELRILIDAQIGIGKILKVKEDTK